MGLFDDVRTARADAGDDDPPDRTGATTAAGADARTITTQVDGRQMTVQIEDGEVQVEEPETQQPDEEGTWLTGTGSYGRPRGVEALENRQIVQTSAMQAIVNGVVDNLLGGELVFEAVDDVMADLSPAEEDAAADLRSLIRQVLEGPHLQGESLDDLVTAAVEDMMGPGNAYWQLLGAETSDLPVVAMTTLDPLTIRHNVDRHGVPGDPPYWQAHGAFSSGGVGSFGSLDPVPLTRDDLAVFSYPKGNRSYRFYPVSPAWQVREWLEILANSTTHHNRFYSDNEIPPGVLSFIETGAGTDAEDIQQRLEDASGDPRDVPIVEGNMQWLDLGGTAVNLNIIEEQRWFFFLCLGALGLGKQELGFVEDVNRANGEVESSRVYKRITGPFINQFEQAFRQIARQFDPYVALDEPFRPTISFSDPREEHAREQRLREQYQAGGITLRQYVRRRGDEDLAEDDDRFTVEVAGETIDYGDHPKWVAQRLMSAAAGDGVDADGDPDMTPDAEDGEA